MKVLLYLHLCLKVYTYVLMGMELSDDIKSNLGQKLVIYQ